MKRLRAETDQSPRIVAAVEKQKQHRAYMARKIECPACHTKGTIKAWRKTENNGIMGPAGRSWITHLVCSGCKIHMDPPPGEVVMTGEDNYWLAQAS